MTNSVETAKRNGRRNGVIKPTESVANGKKISIKKRKNLIITENDNENDFHRLQTDSSDDSETNHSDHGDFDTMAEKQEELISYGPFKFRTKIVWRNVFTMTILHALGIYGWYQTILYSKWQSFLFAYTVANLGGIGVLCGAHRLWTHRSYKAHWSLRFVLMVLQTVALQNDIYEWVRDHRVHHKYSETDADPHNSRRGFFFAHVGWLMCRKHPEVREKGRQIDLSDVWADPIVRFQRRFYIPLVLLLWGVMPVVIPFYLWGEPLLLMTYGNIFRYVISLHQAWLVNSAAHLYGYKPYEKSLEPRENSLVVYLSLGEGYHNYHHTFPWDYSASEHGWKGNFNGATLFIDFFAWLGLATDRRVVSRSVVEQRVSRTGDKTLIPPSLLPSRKPVSLAADYIYALLITTWPLWSSGFLALCLRDENTRYYNI